LIILIISGWTAQKIKLFFNAIFTSPFSYALS
jgi:hypothetical protein